jgi:hypothetical protein
LLERGRGERYGCNIEVEGKEGMVEGEVYCGVVEIETLRMFCASRKETRMWSMADHESVTPDVVERLYVE